MSRPQAPMPSSAGVCEVFETTIRHFFPDFWKWIDDLADPRQVIARCQYTQRTLVATELFRCFSGLRSHREMDSMFNGEGDAILENLHCVTGTRPRHVPRGQTINYWLKGLSPDGTKSILDRMVMTLLRGKRLETCREPLNGSLMLGADGTGLICTIRPIGHSTFRKHRDGQCTRHVYVLLVSFLSPDGIIIPFQVEFIENGEDYRPEFDKQDCEHKAQTKLFSKIHKHHPRLPVTMLMDALSLDYTQMANCIENRWDFVISYREGAVKGLAEAIGKALSDKTSAEHLRSSSTGADRTVVTKEYTWCQVPYTFGKAQDKGNSGFPVTYAKLTVTTVAEDGRADVKTYERITSHSLSAKNIETFFDYMGGTRWCEENQGFNEMKNLGLNIGHAYGCRGEAVVNHFLIQMIAFVIMQLAGKTDLRNKIETLQAKPEGNAATDAGGDEKKAEAPKDSARKAMRRAFSSLFVIGRKFLKDVTSRVMRVIDVKAVKDMRVRWAYG